MVEDGVRAYPGFEGVVGRTVPESTPSLSARRRPPASAPNVVVILCDDLGFSDTAPYGSEIDTPNLSRLASSGIRFCDFHSTPVCSTSRAVLLTGMNHHATGVGGFAGEDVGYPGYQGRIAEDVVTAAEVFRHNGYRTLMVGKWHLSLHEEMHDAGRRDTWPLQRGFDRFYGFNQTAMTNLHHPNVLHEDNHAVQVDAYPEGYYFTDDITDRAIEMIRGVKASDPSTPFFLYFAHGAVHAPLMAKPADIEKYRGCYDAGWDVIREQRFRRQLELGVVPPWTELPPRNTELHYASPAWDSLPDKEKRLFARHMEVYAAMVDNVDQNLGRLRAALEELGELDNTIIIFTSDNGASREGGSKGTTQYYKVSSLVFTCSGDPDTVERDYEHLEMIGGPRVMAHYPWGWGMVSNTPFRLHKGTTFAGGHRVPFFVSWPAGIPGRDEIRFQYGHLNDVLPSLIDMIDLETPAERDGRSVRPMTGSSFAEVLASADTPGAHTEQYYEVHGHRGYYREGWEAVTLHSAGTRFDEERWQLFNVERDPAQVTDLAADQPALMDELVDAWEEAAWSNFVYPIGEHGEHIRARGFDGPGEKVVPLLPGTPTFEWSSAARLIQGRSFHVTVSLEHHEGDCGVLVAHGDQGGGYCVYVDDDGSCVFAHNAYGDMTVISGGSLPEGTTEVTLDVTLEPGARWTVELAADGKPMATASDLEPLGPMAPFEGIDVGIDRRSPVSWDVYQRHGTFPYSGTIHQVVYRAGGIASGTSERIASAQDVAETKFQ